MTYMAQSLSLHQQRPSFAQRILRAHDLWRQRQALRHLDDAALDDIGISRAQADTESRRPVWDAPDCWIR